MKVVVISKTDGGGGAAIAARRLNDALNAGGIDATLLVVDKVTSFAKVEQLKNSFFLKARTYLEYLFQRRVLLKDKTVSMFSTNKVGVDVSSHPLVLAADVIHIHWINFGGLSLNDIQKLYALKKPIVWTLHDMWLFTGGCHYSGTCEQYALECAHCPMLHFEGAAHAMWLKKKEIFSSQKLNIITPSKWLGDVCSSASLTKNAEVKSIANTLDSVLFSPISKSQVCEKLGLDPEVKYLLFSAANPNDVRKGFAYFVEAIEIVKAQYKGAVELIVMGKEQKEFETLPLKLNYMGFVKSEIDAAMIYNAASVFVIPSLEDNLPNTIVEALSCGTPSVGFAIGGIKEMIVSAENGYLAEARNAKDLAKGIIEILENPQSISYNDNARRFALENYGNTIIAEKHLAFYKNICQ